MRLLASKPGAKSARAFTMVEIALSIAVVAFALVAIMGVLPTGMTVQKDNREDTIIGQEGRFWLEAIKGGARGIEDLPSFVEDIIVTNAGTRLFNIVLAQKPLSSPEIIALLSMPRSGTNDGTVARVKAITGPAADRGPNGSSFRYELRAEVTPADIVPPAFAVKQFQAGDTNLLRLNQAMNMSLYDVRLTLRWPVVERGNGWFIGNNRKTFRARVAGGFQRVPGLTNSIIPPNMLRTIVPNTFGYSTNFPING